VNNGQQRKVYRLPLPRRPVKRTLLVIQKGVLLAAFAVGPVGFLSYSHTTQAGVIYLLAFALTFREAYSQPREAVLTPTQMERYYRALYDARRISWFVSLGLSLACLIVVFFAPINYPELLMRIIAGIFASFVLFAIELPRNILRWRNA
jgi:hypothetical protein